MSKDSRKGRLGGFELLAQDAADEAYRRVMMLRDRAFGDSPIEHLFYAALVTMARRGLTSISEVVPVRPDYPLERARYGTRMGGHPQTTAFAEGQVQIAGWRVDFLIHYPEFSLGFDENGDPGLARLIVECDGHDFHERTKEQAARDRARDRLAQYEGLPVLRFTGSEIWNDPMAVAEEVLAFMERG